MVRSGTPAERAFARVGLAHAGIRGPIGADSLRGLPTEVAQEILKARNETNENIAEMWSESMARIARLNKEASQKKQVATTEQRGREIQRDANYLALSRGRQWRFGLPGPNQTS